jgi:hypothetical protein
MNNKDSIVGNDKNKNKPPKVSAVGQNSPKAPTPAKQKDSVALQKIKSNLPPAQQTSNVLPPPVPQPPFDINELQKMAQKATGKKLSGKVLESFQKVLSQPQVQPKQVVAQPTLSVSNPVTNTVVAQPTRSVSNPVTNTVAPQAPKIEKSEEGLKKLQQQAEKYSKQKVSMDTLKKLVPAFESVQKSINFVAKVNEKKDFDDQHYTVPATQSLFSLTANQISGMPFWRG